MEHVVIVGAGPAGLSAARSYRASGGSGSVALVGDELDPPYRRPPLTKEFLRGEVGRGELALEDRDWFASQRVDLWLGSPVVEIDADRGGVTRADGMRLPASVCLLATGSEPTRPPIPGAEQPEVGTLRRIGDAEDLVGRAADGAHVAVIGSGFIGCEAACSLAMRGAQVTLVSPESLPQVDRIGKEAALRIAGWLADSGVEAVLGADVTRIDGARRVSVDGQADVEADVVLLATGVAPRAELAEACGLEVEDGAVRVDGGLRAAGGFLLAAGDVACAYNAAAGRHLRVEHWGDALGQGEVAGRVLAGLDASWDAVPGFWSTIGAHTIKYASWADGFDDARFEDHGNGAFTVWYSRAGATVGVLTHERDADHDRGRELVRRGLPVA